MEMKTMTVENVKQFFQVARESPNCTAFVVEFYTGLRRGELLGLRWQDIDFEQGTLSVGSSW